VRTNTVQTSTFIAGYIYVVAVNVRNRDESLPEFRFADFIERLADEKRVIPQLKMNNKFLVSLMMTEIAFKEFLLAIIRDKQG
jgi:hypothetical protein